MILTMCAFSYHHYINRTVTFSCCLQIIIKALDTDGFPVGEKAKTQTWVAELYSATSTASCVVAGAIVAGEFDAYVNCKVPNAIKAGWWNASVSLDGVTFWNRLLRAKCPTGKYEDDAWNCVTCPGESVKCTSGGSTLQLLNIEPGYWRANEFSNEVLRCTYGKAGCRGGNDTTSADAYCSPGYTGALCGTCAANYFYSWSDAACRKCAERRSYYPSIVVFSSATAFLLIGMAIVYASSIYEHIEERLSVFDNAAGTKLFVLFVTAQVLSQFTSVTSESSSAEMSYPNPAKSFVSSLGVF